MEKRRKLGVALGLLLLLVLPFDSALAATRLYFEGFESEGWYDRGFRSVISGTVARTSNKPHEGGWAIRGNFKEGITDPINGVPGKGNPLLECDFGGITGSTPDSLYVSMWARLDNSNWAGHNDAGDPITGFDGKTAYITEESDGTLSMYHSAGHEGSPTRHTLATNNGTSMNQAWVSENWGAYVIWGSHAPATMEPDGQWHHFEYLADYINDTFSIWFDGNPVTDSRFPNGKYPIHPDWKMRGLQIWYVKRVKVEDSTDGPAGEYACGWQIDNIEAWDGLPGGSGEPIPTPGVPGTAVIVN